jgi:hypothetical protein
MTKTEIETYVKKLGESAGYAPNSFGILDLYRLAERLLLDESFDTLSDRFQIVAEIMEVFTKYAERDYKLQNREW